MITANKIIRLVELLDKPGSIYGYPGVPTDKYVPVSSDIEDLLKTAIRETNRKYDLSGEIWMSFSDVFRSDKSNTMYSYVKLYTSREFIENYVPIKSSADLKNVVSKLTQILKNNLHSSGIIYVPPKNSASITTGSIGGMTVINLDVAEISVSPKFGDDIDKIGKFLSVGVDKLGEVLRHTADQINTSPKVLQQKF